jgi:hypothetical protein
MSDFPRHTDYEAHSVAPLKQRLSPILTWMKISGLYYERSVDADIRTCRKPNCARIYCMVVLIMQWMNVLRLAISFSIQQGDIAVRAMVTLWVVQSSINATILFRACQSPERLEEFFNQWEDPNTISTPNLSLRLAKTPKKRFVYIIIIITGMMACINIGGLTFLSFGTLNYAAALVAPFPSTTFVKICCLVNYGANTLAFLLPYSFFVGISAMVKSRFGEVTTILNRILTDAGMERPKHIDELRQLHVGLSKVVDHLDADIGLLFANWYGISIPTACMILYQLVTKDVAASFTILLIFWLIAVLGAMAVYSSTAASLHETVR